MMRERVFVFVFARVLLSVSEYALASFNNDDMWWIGIAYTNIEFIEICIQWKEQ